MASDNLEQNFSFDRIFQDSVITESKVAQSLQELAAQIVSLAKKEDDVVLNGALKAAELKRRIMDGEAGEAVKWMEWMKQNVPMCSSHLYALVRIGSAHEPAKALKIWRHNNRERSKRRVNARQLSENHRALLKLVRKFSDDEAKNEYVQLWKRYRHRID